MAIDPSNYKGPLEDLEKRNPEGKNRSMIIVGVALALLALGGVVFFFIASGDVTEVSDVSGAADSGDGVSIAGTLPIWIALFVPFFAITNKKNKTPEQKKKVLKFVATGIVLVVMLTVGLVFFKAGGN
ncbi:hypothetical protein ACFL2V_15630 [Pseudomonadota bacterium]